MNYLAAAFLTGVLGVLILFVFRLWARVVLLMSWLRTIEKLIEADLCPKCGSVYSRVQLRSIVISVAKCGVAKCGACGTEISAEPLYIRNH